ncbi:MAG TPA: sialidase family protein, partial [Anaerolineales bacterium]
KPGENASFNALHSFAFRGDAMFSRTTNGGASWEAPRSILPTNANLFTIGNQIVVLPDGTLVDVFGLGRGSGIQPSVNPFTHSLVRSTDKGLTWSRIIDISTDQALGARDPDTGRPIRAEGGIPEIAVDPNNGNLYVVWQDSRFSGVDEVAFSMSTDGGFTWTSPIKVNQTPRSDTVANQQAFVPNIRVGTDGTVAVTYYDFRNNTADPGVPTDYWIVHCHANCSNATNWGDEARLSSASFDIEQAPAARGPFGFFLGEYEGLTSIGNNFMPVFIQVNNGNSANRTDVFGTITGP